MVERTQWPSVLQSYKSAWPKFTIIDLRRAMNNVRRQGRKRCSESTWSLVYSLESSEKSSMKNRPYAREIPQDYLPFLRILWPAFRSSGLGRLVLSKFPLPFTWYVSADALCAHIDKIHVRKPTHRADLLQTTFHKYWGNWWDRGKQFWMNVVRAPSDVCSPPLLRG